MKRERVNEKGIIKGSLFLLSTVPLKATSLVAEGLILINLVNSISVRFYEIIIS